MLMRLSQGQLNLLEACPRKFQQVYLEQLGSPMTAELQERMAWGSQFHLLMQQRELGLAIDSSSDDPIQRCVTAFVQAAPELFEAKKSTFRQSEHRRTLEFCGYLLTVIYDLLILDDQTAQILDWKTYPRPQQQNWLKQDWQTRLYPFVLAETSDYNPDQISMTYWFVGGNSSDAPRPQSIHFPYSQQQHDRTRQALTQLLDRLTQWLKSYEDGNSFPQVNAETGICPSCQFAMRCDRDQDDRADRFNLESIAEVML